LVGPSLPRVFKKYQFSQKWSNGGIESIYSL
jgi:hypothetical protein